MNSFVKICLVTWFLLAANNSNAQGLSSLTSAKTAAAAIPTDPLGRTTPRKAIYNFLQSCRTGNLVRAAQYLDLNRIRTQERTVQGPELAKSLCDLLDRDQQFEVDELNNTPDGAVDDGLATDLDRLVALSINGKTVRLQMQRGTVDNVPLWRVAPDSVTHVPESVQADSLTAIEKVLPPPLVTIELLGTPLWVWLALVILALLLSLISQLLSRLVLAILRPILKRFSKSGYTHRLETLTGPLRLLLSVIAFRAGMEFFAPSALARDYIQKLTVLLFVLGTASLAMRIVDMIADRIISRLDPRQMAMSYSVLPLGVRFVKICLFCFAILTVLSQWGYNTNTILAGVGVGGLAVALAAQKTIENLFGGVSVISDRPVLVGDFCKFGSQVGTVEDIGLRSTRIRTLDRTVVTVPNAEFSAMTLENYSRRDRMWFHPTLYLRRDTTPEQISQMMEAVHQVLKDHESVDPTDVPVRFTKIGEQSLDLEIFAYVLTPDFNEYLRVQSDLLLKILEAAEGINVRFAIPIQASVVEPSTGPLSLL